MQAKRNCRCRHPLLVSHQPQWSRRAGEAIDEVRFDMPWCRADSTAVIPSGPGACEWWTFAGLRANATFAEAFTALGIKATPENFSVKVKTEVNELQATLMEQIRASAPALWPASIGTKALDNLKFSDCLPPALAREMLKARLSAVCTVQSVLTEGISYNGLIS